MRNRMEKTTAPSGLAHEIYGARNILKAFVVRNLRGQYRNSYLGFAWQFITPTITILLFYIVFTGLDIRESPIDNYWLYLCSGMFVFNFLQGNLSNGASCIINNSPYIQKMAFPREIIPLAQVTSSFIIMIIAYMVIICLMILTGCEIDLLSMVLFIPFLLITAAFVLGYVFLLSAVEVYVRDIKHFIDAVSRIIFWISPVFYLTNEATGLLEDVIWCNPFTYYLELFHITMFEGQVPEMLIILTCVVIAIVMLIAGIAVFEKLKGRIADLV